MTGRVLAGLHLTLTLLVTSVMGAEPDAVIKKGRQIYNDKKCGICHVIDGKGGKSGPDLTLIGSKWDSTTLKTFMRDPRALVPQGKMPSFRGSEDELDALVAYMASLK